MFKKTIQFIALSTVLMGTSLQASYSQLTENDRKIVNKCKAYEMSSKSLVNILCLALDCDTPILEAIHFQRVEPTEDEVRRFFLIKRQQGLIEKDSYIAK